MGDHLANNAYQWWDLTNYTFLYHFNRVYPQRIFW